MTSVIVQYNRGMELKNLYMVLLPGKKRLFERLLTAGVWGIMQRF